MNNSPISKFISSKIGIASGLLVTILLASYLIYDIVDQTSKTNKVNSFVTPINQEIILFENTFFELLNERFDELYEENANELDQKNLEKLSEDAIESIDEFTKTLKTINPIDQERLNQLKFYTHLNISKNEEKTKSILSQFSPSEKKLSLLRSYIETFSPMVSEESMTKYLQTQMDWIRQIDGQFENNIDMILFLSSPISKSFPDYIKNYTDLSGNRHTIEDYRGKYVLIDFWATWCAPCLAELPYLMDAYNQYGPNGKKVKNKFDIISISLDQSLSTLNKFIAEREIKWPQYGDGKAYEGDLVRQYQITRLPTLYLLNPEGRVVDIDMNGLSIIKRLSSQYN